MRNLLMTQMRRHSIYGAIFIVSFAVLIIASIYVSLTREIEASCYPSLAYEDESNREDKGYFKLFENKDTDEAIIYVLTKSTTQNGTQQITYFDNWYAIRPHIDDSELLCIIKQGDFASYEIFGGS